MNKKKPLVSVIVPCYNHEKYIEDCILSILNQTYKNIELIVIDDGSIDNSPNILKELSIKYDFYFEHQKNEGVSKTLNKCLSYTKSNLIVSISSDDILMLNAIEDYVSKFLELDGEFSLIFGDSFLINDKSDYININISRNIASDNDNVVFSTFIDFFKFHRKDLLNLRYIGSYASLLQGNYLPVGMMYNKTVLLKVGKWNEKLKLEDHELWLRMSKIYKFEYTNTIVSKYRFHESNSTKNDKRSLAIDASKMLMKEKKYCYENDVINEWNEAYSANILRLLKNKSYNEIFIKNNFNYIKIYYFLKFLIKKIF